MNPDPDFLPPDWIIILASFIALALCILCYMLVIIR